MPLLPKLRILPVLLVVCAPAACHAPQTGKTDGDAAQTQVSTSASLPAAMSPGQTAASAVALPAVQDSQPLALVSCNEDIGATAAGQRVETCIRVSPATHPPCNAANSCAAIETEIARSCALFGGQGQSQNQAMSECKTPPKSAEAAVDVIRRYYSALNAHDYATAWQQWGDNGPANQSLPKFTAGFAHTRSVHVTIGALEPAEGGAGSTYQAVPVIVDATLDTGEQQKFKGEYTVRRVNDVDGASAAQLRWHIDSAHLTPVR